MNLLIQVSAPATQYPLWTTFVLALGFIAAATIGSIAWFNSKRPLGWGEEQRRTENPGAADANYDRGITSAETGARQDREGRDFKDLPEPEGGLDTTEGYTVDREGLLNNYAVEPEMYVEEPGDLREKEESKQKQRARELQEVNQPGGKGPGIV